MQLIAEARVFAIAAHSAVGQIRKYVGEPYWMHPERVAWAAMERGMSDEAVAAAWLHDTVEDTKVTMPLIHGLFGLKVAEYVGALTEDRPEGLNRAQRKELACKKLGAACAEVQDLKLLDGLDNLPSVMKHDPKFAKQYVVEKESLLIVLTKASPDLIAQTRNVLKEWHQYEKLAS